MGKRGKPVPVIPFTVRLTESAHEGLGRLAIETGMSKNAVLIEAIERLMDCWDAAPRASLKSTGERRDRR